MTKIVTIPALELPTRIKAIHAGGGVITRMAVERGTYSLTVRWDEQPEVTAASRGQDVIRKTYRFTGAELRTVRTVRTEG